MNCSTYPFVAVRHGIILSAGDSRAAAAAAARVSRCEIRYATPEEYELLYYGRLCRTLPDSERALLEAIATDINRVLFLVENGPEQPPPCILRVPRHRHDRLGLG